MQHFIVGDKSIIVNVVKLDVTIDLAKAQEKRMQSNSAHSYLKCPYGDDDDEKRESEIQS